MRLFNLMLYVKSRDHILMKHGFLNCVQFLELLARQVKCPKTVLNFVGEVGTMFECFLWCNMRCLGLRWVKYGLYAIIIAV